MTNTTLAQRYGTWALIAGASEGTGRAFAHHAASEGMNCILLARRQQPLDELSEELREQHGVECVAASVDLSADNAMAKILAAVGDREVGLLVCNAGGDTTNTHFLDSDVEEWIGQINRNVLTLVRCSHHFGSQMRARKKGGILLIGSGSCYGGANYMAVYSGTKAFDLCFAEGLWSELQPHHVDVLYLVLGRTDTPAFRASLANSGMPVPEGLAQPVDVARVGFERLPFGPVHNWGQEDDGTAFSPISAAARRARVIAIGIATKDVFGPKVKKN